MTIGTYIRTRRAESGLTIKELAAKSKVSHIEIWRYENDKRKNINLTILAKLAKALDCSLVSIMLESGLSSSITESEKRLMTNPNFAKIFFELERRKDLSDEEQKQLADILLRIVRSFDVNR